jgi:fluoride exporter
MSAGRRGRTVEVAALYAAVVLGSMLGGVLRALASLGSVALFGPGFPWGTLGVNVVGSFVIALYASLAGPGGRIFAGTLHRQFVMTGVCGGFTTFSLFGLETLALVEAGRPAAAGLNVALSAAAWLAAAWAGHGLASRINRL